MPLANDSLAKDYQNNKERLQYGRERCKNLPEEEKQKLVEYKKTIIKCEKTPYYNYKKLLFWKIMKNRLKLNIRMF